MKTKIYLFLTLIFASYSYASNNSTKQTAFLNSEKFKYIKNKAVQTLLKDEFSYYRTLKKRMKLNFNPPQQLCNENEKYDQMSECMVVNRFKTYTDNNTNITTLADNTARLIQDRKARTKHTLVKEAKNDLLNEGMQEEAHMITEALLFS